MIMFVYRVAANGNFSFIVFNHVTLESNVPILIALISSVSFGAFFPCNVSGVLVFISFSKLFIGGVIVI